METGHEPASRVPAELAVDEQVHGAGVMALVLQHEILPPGRSDLRNKIGWVQSGRRAGEPAPHNSATWGGTSQGREIWSAQGWVM